MTQSWFRMNAGGRVAGISQSDQKTAEMNLTEGQYLLPFDPSVNPKTDTYDEVEEQWVRGAVALPRLEDDYRFMRGTGYPGLPEQVGVLMKIAVYALSGEPVPQGVRDEFETINGKITEVKADHPKP